MNANANNSEDIRAFVQTSEQAGEYVWVITLVDFGAKKSNVRWFRTTGSRCAPPLRTRAKRI